MLHWQSSVAAQTLFQWLALLLRFWIGRSQAGSHYAAVHCSMTSCMEARKRSTAPLQLEAPPAASVTTSCRAVSIFCCCRRPSAALARRCHRRAVDQLVVIIVVDIIVIVNGAVDSCWRFRPSCPTTVAATASSAAMRPLLVRRRHNILEATVAVMTAIRRRPTDACFVAERRRQR